MNDRMLELLYRSFDSELSPLEQAMLDKTLAESPELRAEQARVVSMRTTLSDHTRQGFSLGFAERVMGRIEKETRATDFQLNLILGIRRSFRWVAAAAVPVLVALAIWDFKLEDTQNAQSTTTEEVTLWETPLERILRNGS
jgi:anti-sigma factor RsiW